MFDELFYWPSVVNAISRVPKEIAIAGVVYFAITDIHKQRCNVRIVEAKEQTKQAELRVEELKLKRKLQQSGTKIETA
jgi:hypothetical protein